MPARHFGLRQLGVLVRTVFVSAFFLVWVAGWTVGVVGADAQVLHTFVRQSRAVTYPSVAGRVVRVERIERTTAKGNHYHDNVIAYAYEVGGRAYEGRRVRFDTTLVRDDWVAGHPVGSAVSVFYDPHNPADAGLEGGLATGDLLFPLLLIPFNAVAIVACGALFLTAGGFLRGLVAGPRDPAAQSAAHPRLAAARRAWPVWRWAMLALALVATAVVLLGLWAGRGSMRFIPVALWCYVLYWAARRAAKPRVIFPGIT